MEKIVNPYLKTAVVVILLTLFMEGCSPFSTEPRPGPDKQSEGTITGAATGAGSGAIIGAQAAAAAGPGAWIGAGFGAIFGLLSGLGLDLVEEDQIRREEQIKRAREIVWSQEMLAEHYSRRLELHPNRDIYPIDWFFDRDSSKLKPGATLLLEAITQMNMQRMPWSRIVVACYTTARDPHARYPQYITKKRSEIIAQEMVNLGIEPRRLYTKSYVMSEPILIDPNDSAYRYRQAVEFIPLDY